MGAKLGHKKGGGRKKGVPNKRSQTLIDRAKELGKDPFDILMYYANADWKALGYTKSTTTKYSMIGTAYEVETITDDQRIHAAKEACQYIHPKRKSIDISSVNPFLTGDKIEVNLTWDDEESDEDKSSDEEADPAAKKD